MCNDLKLHVRAPTSSGPRLQLVLTLGKYATAPLHRVVNRAGLFGSGSGSGRVRAGFGPGLGRVRAGFGLNF